MNHIKVQFKKRDSLLNSVDIDGKEKERERERTGVQNIPVSLRHQTECYYGVTLLSIYRTS